MIDVLDFLTVAYPFSFGASVGPPDQDEGWIFDTPKGVHVRVFLPTDESQFLTGESMPTAQFAVGTLILIKGEIKTFGFDYSKFGAVRAGDTIQNPVVSFVTGGSGVTVGTAEVNTEEFFDFGTRKAIPANKGVIVAFDASGTITPGKYVVSCVAQVGDDPAVKILGKVLVTDTSGGI
jgi:hypothetical protein